MKRATEQQPSKWTSWAVPVLAVLGGAGLVLSVYLVFFQTPLQYAMLANGRLDGSSLFYNQKIFYFHVAHAMTLFGSVFVSGICSIVFLATRRPRWDDVASAATDVSVAFGAVVLITGSIWAKAAWDVWWNAEPRLTMSLLLWLILVGYVLVRRYGGPSADRIAAGMSIFGMVGVPFIYTMVGQDSHPKSGAEGVVANLGPDYARAFLVCLLTFFVWYAALVVLRVQGTRAEREVRELRERALDLGVLS